MLSKKNPEIKPFNLLNFKPSKYLFFTGKGGVGKTSVACSVAVELADRGKRVFLISTDPASNLQDVFSMKLTGTGVDIPDVPLLKVANLDPVQAATEYCESVVAPFRGKLPESAIANMEEQLSGSCTVEIAAFDQFSKFITDTQIENEYDHIIFDTAPTGHTLRMLELPSAWSNFISQSTHGASCLGQLSGLEKKKNIYKKTVKNLASAHKTTLILVTRPERTSFLEVKRSSEELSLLGINNQVLIINGIMTLGTDDLSKVLSKKQAEAISLMPEELKKFEIYKIPLRSYDLIGINNLRAFFKKDSGLFEAYKQKMPNCKKLQELIDDICVSNKKVVFIMGKGGVGKTSVAVLIAKGLAQKKLRVHLATTDPANHLKYAADLSDNIVVSSIDEKQELLRYSNEVLARARETMNEEDVAYVEEDLRSPCTQEIAVFRAFAEIVDKADESIVVIDTAPTGHTLLLLDSSLRYHKEVKRTKGDVPLSVQRLLPRLRDKSQTDVVIVTLLEATPVLEAKRLKEDLERASIQNRWWVVNQSLLGANTSNMVLRSRAENEKPWLNKAIEISKNHCAVIPLYMDDSI